MDMAGHHHNRDPGRDFVRSKAPRDFVSLNIGQTIVDEDEIWAEPLRLFHAVQTGKRSCDLEIRISKRERIFHENKQHLGVIDDKNFRSSFYRPRYCGWGLSFGDGRNGDGWLALFRRLERLDQCRPPRAPNRLRYSWWPADFDEACLLP